MGSIGCVWLVGLWGAGSNFILKTSRIFTLRVIHYPVSCHPTHPIADRWLSCLFEKQSIFPETRSSEVLVLDLGLSGLEDHEAHRRQMALWDSKEAQSPLRAKGVPISAARPSASACSSHGNLSSVRISVSAESQLYRLSHGWTSSVQTSPYYILSLMVRENASLPSSFLGTQDSNEIQAEKKPIY